MAARSQPTDRIEAAPRRNRVALGRFARVMIPCSLVLLLLPALAAAVPPRLVPARYGIVNDRLGYPWDIRSSGLVEDGRNDCFDNGLILLVNGQVFDSSTGQMTPDSREYLLQQQMGSLLVTRRVRIDFERSMVRYLDTFKNISGGSRNVRVELRTLLGGSCQQVLTSGGQPFGGALGRSDFGLVAANPPGNRPTVLFLLADPKSRVRPVIQVSNNLDFRFNFSLRVPPKASATLFHMAAQRDNFVPTQLNDFFKPVYRGRLVKPDIPAKLASSVVNFRTEPDADGPGALLLPVVDLADALDVDRKGHDTLVLSDDARLVGTVAGEGLSITTAYGTVPLDLDGLALLAGGAGRGRTMRACLRNGEVLTGTLTAEKLTMQTAGGLTTRLQPPFFNLLFFRANRQHDGTPPKDAEALITIGAGDRVAVKQLAATSLEIATAWGPHALPLEHVQHLWTVNEPAPIHRVVFTDGSRVSVLLTGPPRTLHTLRWGEISVPVFEIQRVVRMDAISAPTLLTPEELDEDPEMWKIERPFVLLLGNTALSGSLQSDTVRVVMTTGVQEIACERLYSIQRDEDDEGRGNSPAFRFHTRDGERMLGRFEQPIVPLEAMGRVWQVPVEHLIAVQITAEPRSEADESEETEAQAESEGGGGRSAFGRLLEQLIRPEDPPDLPEYTDPSDPFGP